MELMFLRLDEVIIFLFSIFLSRCLSDLLDSYGNQIIVIVHGGTCLYRRNIVQAQYLHWIHTEHGTNVLCLNDLVLFQGIIKPSEDGFNKIHQNQVSTTNAFLKQIVRTIPNKPGVYVEKH